MGKPINNPFYVLLVAACLALLATMFVYLMGWMYVPNPDLPVIEDTRPDWMRWIDRNAIALIAIEIVSVIVLSGLTIGLDNYFNPPAKSGKIDVSAEPVDVAKT